MRKYVVATLLAGALAATAHAQSSLFDRYDVNMSKWGRLPGNETWDGVTPSVAVNGKGTVVILVRKAPYFRFFKTDGTFIKAWGDESMFKTAHSVYLGPDDAVWLTDTSDNVVMKFSPDGKLLMTLGKKGVAGSNDSKDAFNRPNAVGFAPNGDVYVSDGYGNSRIVQFTKDGQFVRIIGGVKGSAPGQLQLPHGVAIDSRGRIVVADADNKRISVFDKDGKFVEAYPAPGQGGLVVAPDDSIYVSDVNAGAVTVIKDGKLVDVIHVEGRPHGLGLDPNTYDVYTASSVPEAPNITKASRKKPPSNNKPQLP